MTKLRLYLQLLRLVPQVYRALHDCDRGRMDFLWSRVEATHRDLGHDYSEDLILPQHQRMSR